MAVFPLRGSVHAWQFGHGSGPVRESGAQSCSTRRLLPSMMRAIRRLLSEVARVDAVVGRRLACCRYGARRQLADAISHPSTIAALFGGAYVAATRRRHASPTSIALEAALAVAIAEGLAVIARHAVGRPRPWMSSVDHAAGEDVPTTPSLPSAHTAMSFALASSVAVGGGPRWPLAGAMAVGGSRLALGVHHPIDVAAGVAVGVGSARIARRLRRAAAR